ncbi:MAG: hypothetical protein RL156_449 [Bacteroidota bacterium]|jgi:hypothetical protein
MNELDFSVIVNMFAMECMVALGKLKHPATQSLEKNMDHAKFTIDVLSVLQEKTANNLSSTEKSLLEQTLSTLRLNYVQEQSAGSIDTSVSDAQ